MKKQTKINLLKILVFVAVLLPYQAFISPFLPAGGPFGIGVAHAFSQTEICTPNSADPTHNISDCINNVYVLAIGLAGFIAVLMFVYAGYLYMTGGDESIHKAKDIFGSTIAALIILFGTYAFLNTLNPNLTKINGVILPQVNCTGAVKCQIPSPATADSVLPPPVAGQCPGCVQLSSLGVPVANSAIMGNPTLGHELLGIKPAGGVPWWVTAAFGPKHRSSCHTQSGTCADAVVKKAPGTATAEDWIALCNAIHAAGFTSIENEIGSQDPSVTAACGTDQSANEPFRTGANIHINMF